MVNRNFEFCVNELLSYQLLELFSQVNIPLAIVHTQCPGASIENPLFLQYYCFVHSDLFFDVLVDGVFL